MSLMYKHEEYPSLHDRAIAADIGGKQPVRDWLDELIEKLPLPSKGRDFTEREIFEANIKVAQDWFGPGVKTDELVAGVVAGFGWLSRPLALTGEFLAKNPILCSVVGALGIAGAGMIADVDHSHAMGHEIGISVGETHLELPSDGLSVFYGDNMAIIGNTQDGVMTGLFMAPGLTMIDGQPMLGDNQREQGYRPAFDLQSGNVAIDHVDDGDKPPFDRYTITFDAGDWQAARILVMRSGQRNNSQMMLNRLEEVAGYGSTGQLFVDVTPDFSGQNAEVKIWGIGQTGEDGKAQIIDLGTKHVSQFDVFPTSQVKEAVLVPVSNGSETVIMVMPTNLTNPEIGEDGVWQATDSTGKHYELVDGAWVEAESPAMQQTNALLDQYHIDPETVTVTEEGGAVNVVDKETGTVLIRTIGEQSKFDLEFGTDLIAAKSCETTPFKPSRSGRMLGDYGQAAAEYVEKLREVFDIPLTESSGGIRAVILLKREEQCWGFVVNNDLLFRDANHVAQRLPLIPMTDAELREFLSERYTE